MILRALRRSSRAQGLCMRITNKNPFSHTDTTICIVELGDERKTAQNQFWASSWRPVALALSQISLGLFGRVRLSRIFNPSRTSHLYTLLALWT